MAISFSRPDPSSPDAVASATFSTSRRGYEQTEVRDLLRMVAAELARLQERERFLDRELRTSQRGAPNPAVALDEEVVTRLLGEEAARILSTAREAGTQIKLRAEETAQRVLREATDEAQRVREEAAVEAARRRQDAAADAESELQMAKQQGREMVNEARAYRERVLSELARRREMARQQIEQLVHGRDRLLQAFERARVAAVDVMAELTPLGEPAEYVNLSPITGPVPMMVPGTRPMFPRAATVVVAPAVPVDVAPVAPAPADETVDESADAAPDDTVNVQLDDIEPDDIEPDDIEPVDVQPDDIAVVDIDAPDAQPADTVVLLRDVHELHADADPDREPAPVVSLFAGEIDRPDLQPVADPEPVVDIETETTSDEAGDTAGEDAAAVDDLFARLRAARAESVAERARMADEAVVAPRPETVESAMAANDPDATLALMRPQDLSVFASSPEAPNADVELDDTPFGRRDAVLTPLIVTGARRLKRILADEQNDVLHALRRQDPVRSLDTMLPWETEHAQRYVAAVENELRDAALAGAASIDVGDTVAHTRDITRANAVRPAVEALSAAIVAPLRERLARAVTAASGDNTELANLARGIYREWKVQRIDEELDDVVRIAFGRGALAALQPGTAIMWAPDPSVPLCSDCDDNALGGSVGAGKQFPTGHTSAPAHEGCRCMLAVVAR